MLTEFLRFGERHYTGDPSWIPPLQDDLRAHLCRRDSGRSTPAARHFLAKRGDRVVGRVSAARDAKLYCAGEVVGSLGHFECESDREVATALFDAAREWLHTQHGVRRVWGPMNGDIWHGYRLMTRGFDQGIFPGEPYNKPFYADLFADYGWREIRAWESVELSTPEPLGSVLRWGDPRLTQARARGYRFEPLDTRRLSAELEKLHPLLLDCFRDFAGFTPISLEEFRRVFAGLGQALPKDWFSFVRGPEGRLVGFAGAILDLSSALRAMQGRRNGLARLRFAWHRRRADRAVFYLVGLRPDEPERGNGLGAAAVRQVLGAVCRHGVRSAVAALMPSDGRSRSLVGGESGPEAQRRYVLYEVAS